MSVVVLDVGKTNLKASLVANDGEVIRSLEAENRSVEENGYIVQELESAWGFMFQSLCELSELDKVSDVIVSTHGSSAMIVNGDGSTTPLLDYESTMPAELDILYAEVADGLEERGANIGLGATHIAKQLFWIQLKHPDLFAKAATLMPAPQYWAWRLCGIASMDITSLTAQSHLWNAREKRFTSLVARQGWQHLMAPVRMPSHVLGPISGHLVNLWGRLDGVHVRCGVHDSAANFHRYQAAGFTGVTLLSCGTWLVGLSDTKSNSIPHGIDVTFQQSALDVPLTSCRAMAGREFEILTGGRRDIATVDSVNRILGSKILALPSFVRRGGLVPNAGNRGRVVGPMPTDPPDLSALAIVYYAMLADLCAGYLGHQRQLIVDGNVTAQPMLGALLASLDPERRVLIASAKNGTATGAALLAGIAHPNQLRFETIDCGGLNVTALRDYHRAWRQQIDESNYGDHR